MSEWKEYRFSEIIELIGGGTPKTSNSEYWNGNIPWLSVADFNTGRKYVSSTEKMISEKGLKESSTRLLNSGDIIISARGTVGVVAMLDKPMTFNQSCYGIRGIESISNINYVYYLLKNTISGFQQIAHGGVFDTITRDTFKEIEISLPTLPEQAAIASVLNSLDDKIDLLHRQNATLEKMAETLFRQWFVEEAKEEWKEGKLSCLVESANTGLDAIRRAPIIDNYTGIKCLRIQDISQSKPIVNWGNTAVSESDYRKAQLKKGDIIMARTCSPGILLHIQEDLPAVFNNGLARIRANKENCHPLFLKYLFKTDLFINHIYGISDGTAVQLNMKLGDLLSFELNIPPKEVLETFIEIIKKWDDKILINQTQIRTLTSLRDTLLPKLMSGEVRVEY